MSSTRTGMICDCSIVYGNRPPIDTDATTAIGAGIIVFDRTIGKRNGSATALVIYAAAMVVRGVPNYCCA